MKHDKDVSRTTGYIFGTGAVFFVFLAGGNSWIQNIFIGIIVGFLAGIILGSIPYFLTQWLDTSFLSHVVIIISLIISSLLLGYIAFFGIYKLPLGRWVQIIPPPETPVGFIEGPPESVSDPIIYITTEENSIFSYNCEYKKPCEWRKIEQPPVETEDDGCWSDPFFHAPPIFPYKRVIDDYQISYGCVEIEFQYKFIITERGKIWEWHRNFDALQIVIVFIVWIIMGLGSGIIGYSSFLLRKNKDT